MHSSMILSTFFYCKERLCVEATDVVVTFLLLWSWITKNMNFLVCEMTLLHCLEDLKEVVVVDATSSIMYNCLHKVIIILWGLDS
jgi:hypothetical protein